MKSGRTWKAKQAGSKKNRQAGGDRCAKVLSQAKHSQRVHWESVEKRKIDGRELWSTGASRIRFMIGGTHDLLPSSQNLNRWLGEDAACPLCSSTQSIRV